MPNAIWTRSFKKLGGVLLNSMSRGLQAAFVLTIFAELVGCASTTSGGAVNVDRTQLLLVPAATVNAQSALAFSQLTIEAGKKRLLDNDQALTQRIRDISNRLIAQTTVFRTDAQQWGWEVHVIEDKDLNAFCMPGGKIMVNTGLVTRLALSDDEIAAVIGHEISHALREHGREKMSQRTLTEALIQGVAAGSNTSNANINATLAAAGAQLLVNLPYSRSMESEADVMGLELMARAGFDPRNAPGVWRKMSQVGGKDNTPAFLRTHPTNDSRLDGLAAAMPKVIAVYSPKSRPPPTDVSTGDANLAIAPSPSSADASTNNTMLRTAASNSTSTEVEIGSDIGGARKLAQTLKCNSDPKPTKSTKGPGFELYKFPCYDGRELAVRCETGSCWSVR